METVTTGLQEPCRHEIRLRPKYLGRTSKKTQRKSGGNSSVSKPQGVLPVGIPRHYRGRVKIGR